MAIIPACPVEIGVKAGIQGRSSPSIKRGWEESRSVLPPLSRGEGKNPGLFFPLYQEGGGESRSVLPPLSRGG
ncbi:MAG: hypothetical protein A2X64_01425 [Ignavibacteria bacterium GWF2_33_9]|nr:MAG: hypothetical protein A2X64_01425 [Ignavibacteria bacterium GWF2_33_9]